MSKTEEAYTARLNQEIPGKVKSDIEITLAKVSQKRKQRVNQKDFVVEVLQEGLKAINKQL